MKYISVIIPIYNAEKYLDETISRIVSQMDSKDELILINDGSIDKSDEICQKYANGLDIRYYQQKNAGAPSARNKGIIESNGKYLFFFDADDILYDGVLSLLHAIIDNYDYDIIVGNYYRYDGKNKVSEFKSMNKKNTWFDYYMMDPFPGCRIYKKELIERYKIHFENVKIGQDLNFNLQFLGVANKVKIIDRYFSDYRFVHGSISHSIDARILDIGKSIFLCEKFYKKNNLSNEKMQLMFTEGLKHINYQMEKILMILDPEEANRYLKEFIAMRKEINSRLIFMADIQVAFKRAIVAVLFFVYKKKIIKHIRTLHKEIV